MVDDLRAMNAPQEVIDRNEQALEAEGMKYEVWPENVEALEVFLQLETQWQVQIIVGTKAVKVYLGLNYTALESVLRMHGILDQSAIFEDLRAMERAVLPLLNARR